MPRDLNLSCKCGQVTGVLKGVTPKNGTLCKCYCSDCRAFARHIGAIDTHDEFGGIDVYQTLPGRVHFTSGREHLRALQLSSGALLRFYAGCCGTQFGNMLPNDKIRFMGLPLPCFADQDAREAMGPNLMVHKAKEAPNGNAPEQSYGFSTARNRAFMRHLASMLFLAPRQFPFFENGKPIAEPYVLSPAEHDAAYAE